MWNVLIQDLRYGFRMLVKNRGLTVVVILTLGLGIGANTAVFSIINAVLLRPLPFTDASRLVLLTEYHSETHVEKTGAPYVRYLAWANQNRVFEQMAAYWNVSGTGFVLGGTASAQRVPSSIVSNSFFSILAAKPAFGRGFVADEETPGSGQVFLVSDGLWRRSFGGSREVLGKTFQLDGETFTLIGVLPAGFQFPQNCDVWVPLGSLTVRMLSERVSHQFWALARLRPGVSLQQAQAEMDRIERQLGDAYPATDANWRVRVRPLRDEFVGNLRRSLFVLFGAVVFIFLIACANVMSLLVARAVAREREFAIRTALGAGRLRLARQALTESLLIASISTAFALLLAKWSVRAIMAFSSAAIPRIEQLHFEWPVLAFAATITLLTTVIIGLMPALQISELNSQESLREGQRTADIGIRRQRLHNALLICEVTLTLMLLCGAGLMCRSFIQLSKVDAGFNPDNLLTMKVALPDAQYSQTEQRTIFLDRLLERIKSLPGVKAAAAVNKLPFSGETNWGSFNIIGRPLLDWARAPSVEGRSISANYFRTMGIPLLRGREFVEGDSDVVIINQAMASKFWPGMDPLGQRLAGMNQTRSREIVGVVGNVKNLGLDAESQPEMYTPYRWWSSMNLIVRGSSPANSLASAIRDEVAALDKDVPLYQVATMDQLLSNSMAPRRFNLFLLGVFAALALILAAVGIYGLLSFTVSRRTREIGLRMALGALPREVLRLIVWQGMRLVLFGLAAGALAWFAFAHLIAGLLYGVSPTDLLTFAGVALLLGIVGTMACLIPARRAMKVDPMEALRYE